MDFKSFKVVGEMLVGELGYTMYWKIRVAPDQELWIDREAPVSPNKEGTCTVAIKRMDQDLIIVDEFSISAGDITRIHHKPRPGTHFRVQLK